MSQKKRFKGVYVIVITPFDDDGDIDEESLRSVVDFCIQAGAHGLVTPANASEFFALSDTERHRVGRMVVQQAAGRVPVILSVNGGSREVAVDFTRNAHDAGASGLMAMPPPIKTPRPDGVFRYFEAISDTSDLPIIVQNSVFVGKTMSPEFLARMVDELEHVHYVKEESEPCTHVVTRIFEQVARPEELHGVFGGQAGRHMLNEMARGICGTMPACEAPELHAAIWKAYHEGDLESARELHNRALPLLNMESLYPLQLYKEVLRRRGVIRSAKVRNEFLSPFDEFDHQELDAILDKLADILVTRGPFA